MKIRPVMSIAVTLALLLAATAGADIYVSQSRGSNQNPGTKEQPVKEIDRAVTLVAPGATVHIAGGTYMGTFGVGFIESDKPLRLVGSYNEEFTARSIVDTPTVFQPDNASGGKARKAFLRFTRAIDGTLIDGIVFDMGHRNAYSPRDGLVTGLDTGRLLRSTERPAGGNSTVEEPIIQVVSAAQAGSLTIQNCVFVNGASFAIQAGLRQGTYRILNNVFVGNRMAAIEVYGTCGARGGPGVQPDCGTVEIANNTILFSWSRQKDMLDMGYGVRIMTRATYKIADNVIGGSILAGIDHSRFNPDDRITIDNNIFFVNKQGDLEYSPASNTKLNIQVEQFDDLIFASVKSNRREIPTALPINKAYLEAFLSARYTEQVDFNPDSPANLWREAMGLNKQGRISSEVSMFMNRYPWRDTLRLFGAVRGVGAQAFK